MEGISEHGDLVNVPCTKYKLQVEVGQVLPAGEVRPSSLHERECFISVAKTTYNLCNFSDKKLHFFSCIFFWVVVGVVQIH